MANEYDQQIIAGLIGIVATLLAWIGKLKSRPASGMNEDHLRKIIRDEISEELRWRSYGQRISDLEQRKE